jgi:hypothetical protein
MMRLYTPMTSKLCVFVCPVRTYGIGGAGWWLGSPDGEKCYSIEEAKKFVPALAVEELREKAKANVGW